MESREITEAEWAESERVHREALEPVVRPSMRRRGCEIAHPVYDFLFTYYSCTPAKLLRWHPGIGVAIRENPAGSRLPEYIKRNPYSHGVHGYTLDGAKLAEKVIHRVKWIERLCSNVLGRGGSFGCFGLHEWAMVYRAESGAVRHSQYPLRLSDPEVARVVESQTLRCTHFDAFRFFTAPARPLNALQPGFDTRLELEQPGCIHTNMDLYKWAYKLLPWGGSEIVRETFLLAVKAREIDMRASPYDLEELGFEPIRIEAAGGREEYVALQTEVAKEARVVREKLMDRARAILKSAAPVNAGN